MPESGNCREAMTYYSQCLDAKLDMMTYAQGPDCGGAMEVDKDQILHAALSKGSKAAFLMASDCPPHMPLTIGNNYAININCESKEEVDKLFASLGDGGKVIMPAQNMFWGSYWGMVTDKFGVGWMFNYELPK